MQVRSQRVILPELLTGLTNFRGSSEPMMTTAPDRGSSLVSQPQVRLFFSVMALSRGGEPWGLPSSDGSYVRRRETSPEMEESFRR